MASRNLCKGITSRNTKCKLHACEGGDYCRYHVLNNTCLLFSSSSSPLTSPCSLNYNDTCPICLDSWDEDKQSRAKLECNHSIHIECSKGLISLECPICRAELKGLPGHIIDTIKQNHIDREIEVEEAERREIEQNENGLHQAHMDLHRGLLDLFALINQNQDIRFEEQMAREMLRNIGVPQVYFRSGDIDAIPVGVMMPRGYLAQVLVNTAYDRAVADNYFREEIQENETMSDAENTLNSFPRRSE